MIGHDLVIAVGKKERDIVHPKTTINDHPSPYPPAADLERHSKKKAKFITIPPDDPNLVARQQGR